MTRTIASCVLLTLLGACSSPSDDYGMRDSARLVAARTGATAKIARNDDDIAAVHREVNQLLQSSPLTEDIAVQIALINNRDLQATYNELGVAEADLVQAGRLENPGFSFNHTRGADSTIIDRSLTFNIVNILTAPIAIRIGQAQFLATKLKIANVAFEVAQQTRIAYIEAIAAQQNLDYAKQILQAADATADLATRMKSAGNWSQLELSREQLFYAQTASRLATSQAYNATARETLGKLLGLSGEQLQFVLPSHLPDIPAQPLAIDDLEASAMRERLDIQIAKLDTERVASELGLTKANRFINVLDLGPARNSNEGAPEASGYQINLEIPLFDWGEAKTERAEALYMQASHLLAAKVINAQSEVRTAYAQYLAQYEITRHYRNDMVPLQKQISAQKLLRYNGMLISVFDLLDDARDQINVVDAYSQALKEFWIADARLQLALGNSVPTEQPGVKQ